MKRYFYQPGNATRYDLVYGRIEGTKQYVLVWLNKGGSGGTALQWEHFDDMPSPDPGYIAGKMQLAFEGDAVAIAQFIESPHPTPVKETS